MMRPPMPIALLAGFLLAGAAPPASPLDDYVRARIADAEGNLPAAARGYAAALADRPGDAALAARAYRQAMLAGDRKLALAAAAVLARANTLPPDGRLLLAADALQRRDWPAADAAIARVRTDDVFGFTVPFLQAWAAFARGRAGGDPLAILDGARAQPLTSAYLPEQRALLLLALHRTDDGVAALRAAGLLEPGQGGGRTIRLKLAAAAALQRDRRPGDAAPILAGNEATLAAARAILAAGRPLPGAVTTAEDGLAELFTRVAVDINRERVTPLALTLARLGTILAPDNAETWLVAGELMAVAEQPKAALAAIAHVAPDDPFAASARAARLQLLMRADDPDTALAEARTVAAAPGATAADWARVGDLQTQQGDAKGATITYGRALALAEADPAYRDRLWTYLLQLGGAQEQGGAWDAAKVSLSRAAALAPNEPSVLNYWGYAQLSRRENLPQAERLIARANQLQPADNAIMDSLGWAYYVRGDLPRAIPMLERAVAGDPGEPTMNEHLGDAYWTAGRRVEARYAWSAALIHAEGGGPARLRAKLADGLTPATGAP